MKLAFLLASVSLSLFSLDSFAASLRVAGSVNDHKLYLTLLKEIVKRSDKYDSLDYVYAKNGEPAVTRVYADLEADRLDVYWTATSIELESRFAPVRFPIYRGMLGMRIGMIHQKDANMLANVRNKTDMMKYSICSGKTWSDTQILESNGFTIAKSLKYKNIFEMMLAGNRCHLFARGLMEPFNEMRTYPELPLAVDKHVMLRYQMPYMFFVNKNNPQLAAHLLQIIEEIFEDGTYEKLFFNEPEVKAVLAQANVSQRVVIELENPYLTEATRSIPKKYFYDPLQP
ncbi:amino acid ABC transporter substrate-binding protein [Vibrio sp. SM6]|uniref:Amino acid ABC transporter substrate-binding protein n=1 Tax=Vibrio agarilyticus TaxID=2726741 RepID=A0A7X8YH28_9VIBR|nr:amino acid ABC transporter substrate-binding protein [Vibrio agarilyticus]NLS12922.1 amino acid ABC transporter substrate-binding protein [Vibrio agarilyticus]